MKTIFKRTSTHLLIATLAAGMGVHLASLAQSTPADTGQVVITGSISASTCSVNVSDPGSTTTTGNGSKSLFLGNNASTTGTLASTFGTPVAAMFTLGNATTPSSACVLQGGATAWDLSLGLTPAQITTISGSTLGTTTFLKNSINSGGTDAVVVLKGGVAASPAAATAASATNFLTLKGDGLGLLSGGTAGATSTGALVLTAQWVRSAASAPTPGQYSQTIPLTVLYK